MNEKASLRVLWLTENYHPSRGGMAQSCDRIVRSLGSAGVVVDVVHFTARAQKIKVETKRYGRYVVCPPGSDPSHAMNCLWNTLSVDASGHPATHVVAFGGSLPLLAGPVYAAWMGTPLITLIRGNDFDVSVFTPRRRDVLRDALERAAKVCVVSQDKARKITALYPGICPLWIPNGIDLTEWQPLPSHLNRAVEWRRQNVEPGRRVLGMFGQTKPKKGGLFFLEALLSSGHASMFHLLFVGELDEEIIEWLDAHKTEIAYSLYPFVDRYELLAYYSSCDLVVIASFYDGLPNVLLEAAALGIPLLASTAGGMADVLVDGRHGFLFHPGDPHGCRRAIDKAANALDEELKKFGSECRSMIRTELNHHVETQRYIDVLMETLGQRACLRDDELACDGFDLVPSTMPGENQ